MKLLTTCVIGLAIAFGVSFLYVNSAIGNNSNELHSIKGAVPHLATKADIARLEGKLDQLLLKE